MLILLVLLIEVAWASLFYRSLHDFFAGSLGAGIGAIVLLLANVAGIFAGVQRYKELNRQARRPKPGPGEESGRT
jgi:hypothetical protein